MLSTPLSGNVEIIVALRAALSAPEPTSYPDRERAQRCAPEAAPDGLSPKAIYHYNTSRKFLKRVSSQGKATKPYSYPATRKRYRAQPPKPRPSEPKAQKYHYEVLTQRAVASWPSRDPIGERGGVNLYGVVGNDGVNRFDLLGLTSICDCVELEVSEVELRLHGFLWLQIDYELTEVANGGSVSMGDIGDVQGRADWVDEADDADHPCCKIKKENPELKMEITGTFTPEVSDEEQDIEFFQNQYFMILYPHGVQQPTLNWWTQEVSGPPRADSFAPRNNRRGSATYLLYVKEELCDEFTINFE